MVLHLQKEAMVKPYEKMTLAQLKEAEDEFDDEDMRAIETYRWSHRPYPGCARPQVRQALGACREHVGGDTLPSKIQFLRENGNIHRWSHGPYPGVLGLGHWAPGAGLVCVGGDTLPSKIQFLRENGNIHREKRLQEWKALKKKQKFGELREISGNQYVNEVTNADKDVWVIIHLYRSRDDGSIFDGLVEEDDKDKAKRVSRNKSEKKRRDQFNVLIKELGSMLPGNARKMDKSTVLQKSIDFLRKHKEITAQSDASEIRQDWKPTFLSNEEFTQLMLESDLVDQSIFNFIPEGEHSEVYKILSTHLLERDSLTPEYLKSKNQLEFCCHMLRGTIDPKEPSTYEYVKFIGNFKSLNNVSTSTHNGFEGTIQRTHRPSYEDRVCFVATVRLATPQFIKEMCTVEEPNEEFTSRHSLEWKFLFLDHSYAEVRAERRRELGIEESLPEIAADKSQDSGSDNRINTVSLKEALERFDHSPTPSASSRSSRKSSHTAVSDPSSTPTKIPTDTSTPPRQHLPGHEKMAQRRSSFSSQSINSQSVGQSLTQPVMSQATNLPVPQGMSQFQFSAQLGAMQHLKDQLEQRTRMIEANIHRQQEELRKIQEQLQMVHGQGLQMFLQQSTPGLNFGSVQLSSGNSSNIQQLAPINMQGQVVQTNQIQSGMNTGHIGTTQHMIQQHTLQSTSSQSQQNVLSGHSQQTSLPSQTQSTLTAPLYNTMVISQPAAGSMVQIPSSMPQNSTQSAAVTTFTQDRQIRFSQGQQLVTKLVTAPVACGAVMVPSTMLMGQVTSRLLHGNPSTQLILSAAFPLQQSTFPQSHHQQHQSQQQQQLNRHRTDSLTDPSKVQPQ
ncbi:Circadian locomoter output cycles protein kaput [Pteropus alecto]|uniref:Circadian locomoter output cycles protein kaput n=1 Tax=Pteropus alecto TaxID=9402 RepID=L5JW50_PTEAL|nr:Circadian locomoter output cycles protein kaput [Pteropus alecto]